MIANDSLPLRHLHRMHLIFSGNLPDRFDAHQRFQSNFGLEGTCVPLALSSFAHCTAVLSSPAEPEKSNLDHCPNFGVHFRLPCAVSASYLARKNSSFQIRLNKTPSSCHSGWLVSVNLRMEALKTG